MKKVLLNGKEHLITDRHFAKLGNKVKEEKAPIETKEEKKPRTTKKK
jgi:hypothetical protein